ncbi:MAG: NADP-dependent malic enzyme [Anaerolineales bacterium]|nr:NADP-dependent malic enzyme [Anaerolineales bacterium]
MKISKQDVLEYHSQGRPGKIEVVATKPLSTQRHLSLAYSPGVAEAVLEVERDPLTAYQYTAKSNLVAVISNGTAILGLGHRGALASKPVMEGKGVLFKTFADIDVFDIEVDSLDVEEIISVVRAIAPTFGGINLEDIKAPECFEIETRLKEMLPIPVFHDDQHGTAIISAAALMNGLELTGKHIEDLKVVVSGAGASAIACANLYIKLGVRRENVLMVDSKGVIYAGRTAGMNKYKEPFAVETKDRTLEDAMKDADVFLGLSAKDLVSQDMVKTMAPNPMIFAMANPDPEIPYPAAREARPDAIIGTGRSDYPNQVNNVLGFPFIFRGALDVAAVAINDEMKLAAARSLAALAHEDVPDSVLAAYGGGNISFGQDYVIPKPLDPRVLIWEAPAVAQAAMETGVAGIQIDIDEYRERLAQRQGLGSQVKRFFISKARQNPKRVVFSEGEEPKIIRAASQILDDKIGHPVLIGNPDRIRETIQNLHLDFDPEIIYHRDYPRFDEYVEAYYNLRKRKGEIHADAQVNMRDPRYLGPMMVYMGDADAYLAGLTAPYPRIIRPALQILKTRPGVSRASGVYLMLAKGKVFIFTDATVNLDTNSEDLAEIAVLAHDFARNIDLTPVVAMLSFSNFGSTPHPMSQKVREAVQFVRERRPDICIDGEVQADFAVNGQLMEEVYPFSEIRDANVLVFPDLGSANVAYKLVAKLGGAETIGPILLGVGAPAHVLQQGESVENIVAMAAVAVMDAQMR